MAKNLEKNKKLVKIYFNYALLVFLIILTIFLIINLISNFNILEKKEIFTSFTVSEHVGFDLNNSALTFGLVQPGHSSSREIFIENNHDVSVLVIIQSKGDISDFLIVSENSFYLNSGEEKKIDFSVILPKDLEFGKYEGEIEVIFKKF